MDNWWKMITSRDVTWNPLRFHKLESNEFSKSPMILSKDEGESPRGVFDISVIGVDSDHSNCSSSDCLSPSFNEENSINNVQETFPSRMQWKNLLENFKRKSKRRLLASTEFSRTLKRKVSRLHCGRMQSAIELDDISQRKPSWRSFEFWELSMATDNFNSKNLIGKGRNAEVYRGILLHGQAVAVKKLMKKRDEDDRTDDFLSELGIIAHINHLNAARLIGFSLDGGFYLVLQLAPHGNLSAMLHGSEQCLQWNIRFKVAVGVAEGLQYLHHDCQRRIIHRDIKASNILLAENYKPQISDFGIAKWLPGNCAQHVIFPIEGTFGYLSPEYFMNGIVNEKTDVFAFGVLLLELVTGRRAVDSFRQSLVTWAKPLLDGGRTSELVDPRLGDRYDAVEMKRSMATASMCINHVSSGRPYMTRVVRMLKEGEEMVEVKQKWDCCDDDEYMRASRIEDLDCHRRLVLE